MSSPDSSTPCILLVEDETFLRELVMENLQDAGYSVVESSDGNSGVEALKSDLRIGVLLSDIKLPDIEILALARTAGVQILEAQQADNPCASRDAYLESRTA